VAYGITRFERDLRTSARLKYAPAFCSAKGGTAGVAMV